jgi:hypothetical protein
VLLIVKNFNVVVAKTQKQEKLGASRLLLIVKNFNVVATRRAKVGA